jgi:hypothetical protein
MDNNIITFGRSLFYLQAESTVNDSVEDLSAAATTNYGTTNKAHRKMKAQNEKYKRINCMFILISIIVVLTYLPRFIITVFEMNNFDFWQQFLHDGNNASKELLIMVSIYRLYMISFFINPIVYSVMDRCDSHVERETKLGNNCITGYRCWDSHLERETELGNNCRTNRILLLGLPYNRISLLAQPCRKGNGVREQLLYRILLLAQRCRKGNRVSKQLVSSSFNGFNHHCSLLQICCKANTTCQ